MKGTPELFNGIKTAIIQRRKQFAGADCAGPAEVAFASLKRTIKLPRFTRMLLKVQIARTEVVEK